MTSKPVLFFKIIISQSLQQGILKLPKNFSRKYGASLPKPVFLKPPNGTEWKVDWTMHDADVVFENGWKEFVKYYSINHGYVLKFEYNGNSKLGVQICDKSGLEIEYPVNVNQQEKVNIIEISDEEVQAFDEMPQRQNNRRKSPKSQLNQRNGNQSQGTSFLKSTSTSIEKELDGDRKETQTTSKVKSPLAETSGTLKEAEKFTSKNPFFIINVTKKFLDQSRPNVPIDFVKKYLKQKQFAMVRFRDKLWPLKLLPYVTKKESIRLSTGWNLFAKASELQAGDKIPNSFTKKYGDGLSNPVFLKPPDGTEWKVEWTKQDDGIFLEHGWNEFAMYYSLDHGHLLFFEYKNTSQFEVQICEVSGLEIDYPFHVIQQENENIEQINHEADQVFDDMPQSQNNRMKSPMSYPQPSNTTREVRTSCSLQNLPLIHQINGNECQGTSFDESTFASIKKELDEDIGGSTPCPRVERLKQTLNKATTSKSRQNPSFMVIMKPSYAKSYSMNIPSKFTAKYLKKQATAILEVHDGGRTWAVTYSFGKFSSGWKRFAKDNSLNVGDICVFELTNPKDLYFKVSITRIEEEELPLSQVEGDRVNCLEPAKVNYVESKSDIMIKVKKETQETSLATPPGFEPNEEALKEAKKFTSENPFFMVIIKPSFLRQRRPSIPAFFIRNHLKKTHIVTFKFGETRWRIKLLRYTRYRSPITLSNGWSLFCRGSRLKAGDVCIFELINKEDAVFDVHLFRCHS
ncbi:hypothetical protein S83_072031 [Arachis hypogaea]